MAELNVSETDAILKKLRAEYSALALESPQVFKPAQFEERYLQVLRAKVSVSNFLRDEVTFLEQMKKKFQDAKAKREAAKGETINKIIEEQEAGLENYPKIDFHPIAKKEIRYLYGAVKEFSETEMPVINYIFKGTPEMELFKDALMSLEKIGLSKKGYNSQRINEHVKELLDANGLQVKIEAASQNLLKEACIVLKKIMDQTENCIQKNLFIADKKIKLAEDEFPKSVIHFQSLGFLEALKKIQSKIRGIIMDFRMDGILGIK